MALTQITDHVDQGVDRLIEQFKNKPRLEAWLTSFLNRVQELEDGVWEVLAARLLDTAVDDQLAALGRIVGQTRRGETEEIFRLYIRARIRINSSHGHPSDVIEVAQLLLGSVGFQFDERYPTTFVINVTEPPVGIDVPTVAALICEAGPVGVSCEFHWSDADPDTIFTLSDDATTLVDSNKGFSGVVDTNDGGELTGAI